VALDTLYLLGRSNPDNGEHVEYQSLIPLFQRRSKAATADLNRDRL